MPLRTLTRSKSLLHLARRHNEVKWRPLSVLIAYFGRLTRERPLYYAHYYAAVRLGCSKLAAVGALT
jgi:hypothetical protein